MTQYLVSSFQHATLSALIRECFDYDFADIYAKRQITYIFNYLRKDCATILLEPAYIDREFLEDYSRYYVKRFGNDGYVCGRLHFFSRGIDHENLDLLLLGREAGGLTPSELQKHYLGFMVVKPLSRTFVGKTCLKLTGDTSDGAGTKKKIVKRYDVNLFGIKLHVDSIAFQEQDKVVAACATTAIWTALHGVPWRDVRHVPSCSEITINAINFVEGSSNGFPNKELTNKQIQRSLDVEALRYHSTNLAKETIEWFQACVTAYVDSELPLILSGMVYGVERRLSTEQGEPNEKLGVQIKAGHAVTVLGYDFRGSSRWLYVHDDRLGPYARVDLVALDEFLGSEISADLSGKWALAFRQKADDGESWYPPHEILIPDVSIVPADKKARLSFQYAYGTATVIAKILKRDVDICLGAPGNLLEAKTLNFNIKLSSISQVRENVLAHRLTYKGGEILPLGDQGAVTFTDRDLEMWEEDRTRFLTSPMARLQWEMDFTWGEDKIFKVLLDATDIPLGNAIAGVYAYDPLYSELFLGMLRRTDGVDPAGDNAHFFGAFLKALELREVDYEDNLNLTYGSLRAPLRLEDSEISDMGKGRNKTLKHYYDPKDEKLTDLFPGIVADGDNRNLIWAIGRDGSFFVAEDIPEPKLGHPSMTGLQAARIAGEMWWTSEGWHVNHCSGRYSGDYTRRDTYLANAVRKIKAFFGEETFLDKKGQRPPVVEKRFAENRAIELGVDLAAVEDVPEIV